MGQTWQCHTCCVWTGSPTRLLEEVISAEDHEFEEVHGVLTLSFHKNDRVANQLHLSTTTNRVLILEEDHMRMIDVYSPSPISTTVVIQMDVDNAWQQCFFFRHLMSTGQNDDITLEDREKGILFLNAIHEYFPRVPLTTKARQELNEHQQFSRTQWKNLKRRRVISSNDFYGKQVTSPVQSNGSSWNSFYQRFQYQISHSVLCQLEGTAPLSCTFPRQQEAFDFMDQVLSLRQRLETPLNSSQYPRVFCFEGANEGKRRFWVTTMDGFWHEYQEIPKEKRHVYEIIREGIPCRLYFDLEYQIDLNPDIDGNVLVKQLVSLLQLQLYRKYHLLYHHVIQLDSSTSTKFSQHLIIHLPNDTLFISNLHVGAFVRQFVHDFNLETSVFVVKDRHGDKQLFIDRGVYTRNRMFRVLGSSKHRKTALLLPYPICTWDEILFRQSLVCPFGTIQELEQSNKSIQLIRCEEMITRRSISNSLSTRLKSIESKTSFFPKLDQFICSIAINGGIQGEIRAVHQLYDTTSHVPIKIIYHMTRNRWCEHIGRAHKGNNIMFVVDVVSQLYLQRCHDPDCQRIDYRSPSRTIPSTCFL